MTMNSRLGLLLTVALAGYSISCIPEDDSDSAIPVVTRRDSAGIRIVESNGPSWGRGSIWRLDSVPEVSIGSTRRLGDGSAESREALRGEVPLEMVQGLRVLRDGRIVVADGGSSLVMVFDTMGTLISRFGGRGEGPGEIQWIYGAFTLW